MSELAAKVGKASLSMNDRARAPLVLIDKMIPGLEYLFHRIDVKQLDVKQRIFVGDIGDLSSMGLSLSDVEAIFIRSTTRVDALLLGQLPRLNFIATATSGIDHLDLSEIIRRGIRWVDAKGSNAKAVADYVLMALDALVRKGIHIPQGQAAVVGYGYVGREVYKGLRGLGFDAIWADPLIEEPGSAQLITFQQFTAKGQVEGWLKNTALLCIHTPYTTTGPWQTHHWLNEARLAALPDGAIVICAGRGEALVSEALKKHSERLHFVLDVWPSEPAIELDLLARTAIATPHIAGHSKLGKLRGAWQTFRAYCAHRSFVILLEEDDFYQEELKRAEVSVGVLALPKPKSLQIFCEQGLVGLHQKHDLLAVDRDMRLSLNANEGSLNDSGATSSDVFKQLRKAYAQHFELDLMNE